MFRSQLMMLLGAVSLSTAAIACEPPGLTDVRSTPGMTAKVSSALSSSTSESNLGIARWHSTVLSGGNGKKAGTVDGQDTKGKVRFLATIREDKATSTLHIESLLPKKGEWVFDAKKQKVIRNTIPASTMTLVNAFSSDWMATHPDQATTSTHAGIRATAGAKTPGSSKVGPDDPVADAGNYWLIQLGHKYGMINDRLYDIYMDQELGTNTYNPSNYDAKGKRIDPAADPKPADPTPETKTPEETPETKTPEGTPETKTPEETPTETPETKTPEETPETKTPEETPETKTPEETPETKTPEETPETKTPEETPTETPDDLPKESKGGDLDEVPEQPAGETVGNDIGDQNLPSGGDGTETAIIAKHTVNTTPNTRCKTAATSKTTGIRACLQY